MPNHVLLRTPEANLEPILQVVATAQRPKTPAAVALNERLLTAPDRDIVTTVVSFEE